MSKRKVAGIRGGKVDLKSLRRAVKRIQETESYLPSVYWLTEWLLYFINRFENFQADMNDLQMEVPELDDPLEPPFDEDMN